MKDGFTPIFAAAANGHGAVTEQLIVARCNVDFQDVYGQVSNSSFFLTSSPIYRGAPRPAHVFLVPT
jgi:hypothetical protein